MIGLEVLSKLEGDIDGFLIVEGNLVAATTFVPPVTVV